MSAFKTDAGHGTVTHYRRGCRCEDCTRGAARYEQERQLDLMAGKPRRIPILGSRRRLQALVAIGYDWKTLGRELGVSDTMVWQWATVRTWMYRDTADRITAAYERLSMTFPPEHTAAQKNAASRARGRARRDGWIPPLAWDNPDDPAEVPTRSMTDDGAVDDVVVQRVLNGDTTVATTNAERREVVRRWRADGRPLRQLEQAMGWSAHRYYDSADGQVAS